MADKRALKLIGVIFAALTLMVISTAAVVVTGTPRTAVGEYVKLVDLMTSARAWTMQCASATILLHSPRACGWRTTFHSTRRQQAAAHADLDPEIRGALRRSRPDG